MVVTLLPVLPACSEHPDRVALRQLVIQLHGDVYGVSSVEDLNRYSGDERVIRQFAWYHRQEVRTIDAFPERHPNLSTEGNQMVVDFRDKCVRAAKLYERLVSSGGFSYTTEEKQEWAQCFADSIAAFGKIVAIVDGADAIGGVPWEGADAGSSTDGEVGNGNGEMADSNPADAYLKLDIERQKEAPPGAR